MKTNDLLRLLVQNHLNGSNGPHSFLLWGLERSRFKPLYRMSLPFALSIAIVQNQAIVTINYMSPGCHKST